MSRLRVLSDELKRRQVYRVAAVYAAGAFVAVQVAELFLPRLGLPDWIVTIVVMASVVGFPVAVALAWAFEATPEGVRRTPATPGLIGGRPGVRIAVALLVAGAFLMAGGSWIMGTLRPSSLDRLAVLPMVNLASDPGQEYFAAGMHEALISELARAGVPVLAASAVRRFAGSPAPPREIAAQLRVDRLIEASVLRVNDSVRVQVRLVEAATEEHLWARTYDAEVGDVLGLHRQLTREIADAVEVALTSEERARLRRSRRVDPGVYDAYLRGMHALSTGTPDRPAEAIGHLRAAIDLDAADPLPHAGLAKVYATIGHSVVGTSEDLDRAKAAADHALRIDPDQPLANAVLAEILFYRDWNIGAAGTAFRRAIALDPSQAATRANYAWWLQLNGDLDDAIAEIRRAEELDPLMPLWPAWNAWLQWWAGVPPGELVHHARRALDLVPDHPVSLSVLTFLLAASGQTDAAIAAGERARARSPLGAWPLAFAYAHAGRRAEALALLEQLERDPRGPVHWGMAEVYAALGENDRAIRSLERAYEQRFNWMIWAATAPTLAPLRDDPRFQDLVRRVGWPPRVPAIAGDVPGSATAARMPTVSPPIPAIAEASSES